jgi:hypothetical protein
MFLCGKGAADVHDKRRTNAFHCCCPARQWWFTRAIRPSNATLCKWIMCLQILLYEVRDDDDSARFAHAVPEQKSIGCHFQPKHRQRCATRSRKPQHRQIHAGCQNLSEVEYRLLVHREVYQVWLQAIQLPRKSYLFKRIQRELSITRLNPLKILVGRLPIVVGLYQNGVAIQCITSLQMLNQAVYVASRAGSSDPGIYHDMLHGLQL